MFLSIDGNQFVFDGRPVTLRGVGVGSWLNLEHFMVGLPGLDGMLRRALDERRPGLTRAFEDSFFTDADAAWLRSLGVNFIRVPLNYRRLYDERTGAWVASGFETLRRLADVCERHRLFFMPDMHAVPGGQNPDWHSECAAGTPLFWEHRALWAQTARVWREGALALKDCRWLAGYDLLNEPTLPPDRSDALNTFHAMAAEAIREVDPEHLLFIEGSRFAMDYRGVTLPDPGRSCYTYHFYPAVWDTSLADPDLPEEERRAGFRAAHDRIMATMDGYGGPLLCGETGFELRETGEALGLRMLAEAIEAFEYRGASWCVWAYKDTGMMGLCCPRQDGAWQKLCADVARRWSHHGDMARGEALADWIDAHWFDGALTPEERYAMQFRLRAALFEPEVEHIVKPALARLSDGECDELQSAFRLEQCAARDAFAALLTEKCGASRQ